jgi:hypothetical protein
MLKECLKPEHESCKAIIHIRRKSDHWDGYACMSKASTERALRNPGSGPKASFLTGDCIYSNEQIPDAVAIGTGARVSAIDLFA